MKNSNGQIEKTIKGFDKNHKKEVEDSRRLLLEKSNSLEEEEVFRNKLSQIHDKKNHLKGIKEVPNMSKIEGD